MATTVKWSMSINAVGGPKLAPSGVLEVEGYDVIDVEIEPQADAVPIPINSTGAELQLLAITADYYGADGLTYTTENDPAATTYVLDGPHLMFGSSSLVAFSADPLTVFVSNGSPDNAIQLTLFVGRNVTPE